MESETQETVSDNTEQQPAVNPQARQSRKRCRSEAQKRERNLSKRRLLRPCITCKLQCSAGYTEEYRQQVLTRFWSLSYRERRQWLDSYIKISDVQRRRVNSNDSFRKNRTLTFSLPKPDATVQRVCKKMFMNTLGLTYDSVISEFVKAKLRHEDGSIAPVQDRRGKRTPPNKIDTDIIVKHIESYQPAVSHYRREHAPNRRYLEPHLTVIGI